LAEQLRLQREDVVEDAVHTPSFQAVVGDDAGPLEVSAQRNPERPVNACLTSHLCLFEQL
jgi:hypothetical protein